MTEPTQQTQEHNLQGLLDAKNALLDEKKTLKAKFDELQAHYEQVVAERDNALSEVERITIKQPRQELLESVAAEGRAGMLERELLHHFELVRLEDGTDALQRDGEVIAPFTQEGLDRLHKDNLLPGIGSLLKGSGATGGGAAGAGRAIKTTPSRKPAQSAFGLK